MDSADGVGAVGSVVRVEADVGPPVLLFALAAAEAGAELAHERVELGELGQAGGVGTEHQEDFDGRVARSRGVAQGWRVHVVAGVAALGVGAEAGQVEFWDWYREALDWSEAGEGAWAGVAWGAR